MEHLRALLRQGPSKVRQQNLVPLAWSEALRGSLRRIATGQDKALVPIDIPLSSFLLMIADGGIPEAENGILALLRENVEQCVANNEVFISLLNAAFTMQRFDLVAAMLQDRHCFSSDLEISVEPNGLETGQVQWELTAEGKCRFIFDTACFSCDNTRLDILALHWEFPLLAYYAMSEEREFGSIVPGRRDIGKSPGLAYCDSRPEFFLIPDCIYVPSRGYSFAREAYERDCVAWQNRRPVGMWRGSTTGIPSKPGDWMSLPRIKLCEISRKYKGTGLIDAGISSVVQFTDPGVISEIKDSGLISGFMPWQHWNRYKYLIDIDGNSSPWSNLFQRLLTGSAVLKVESPSGYRQWYYDRLVPWANYVPIASDMWDLMEKIEFLNRHDALAERIGQRGAELARELSFEAELERSVPVVSAAFRVL